MPSQSIQSNMGQGQGGTQPQQQEQAQAGQQLQIPQIPSFQTAGAQTQAAQPGAQPASQQASQPQPPSKKSKWWLWMIIIFGILIVLGAIAYFVFK